MKATPNANTELASCNSRSLNVKDKKSAKTSSLRQKVEEQLIELEILNEELLAANAKIQTAIELYDSAPSGYFTLDRDGTICELNLAGANLLDKERHLLVNNNFKPFLANDTLLEFNDFLRKIFETKTKQTCEVRFAIKDPHTSFVHLEGIISNNKNKCLITAIDVTEYKKNEEKLIKTNSLLSSVINSTPDFIFVKDINLKTILSNKAYAATLCKKPEDMIGHSDTENGWSFESVEGNPKKGIRGFKNDDMEALNGKVVHNTYDPVNNGSQINIYDTLKAPLYDENKNIIGLVGIARDITKTIQTEKLASQARERLISANKLKSLGILSASVAHEINNPNMSIMLNLPIIKNAWEDIMKMLKNYYHDLKGFTLSGIPFLEACKTIPELLDNMSNSSVQIKKIVSELKDYVVIKNRHFVFAECNINDALKAAISLLQPHINRSTYNFQVDYGSLPNTRGDIRKLEQVIVNLIQNACQSLTNKEQAINIRSYCDSDNNAVIEIKDEGEGVAPEDIPRLTEPFYTRWHDKDGAGLGLTVSSDIITNHNGKLLLDSEIGKGTTVRMVLPALNLLQTDKNN